MIDLVKTRQHEHILRAGFDRSTKASYGSSFAYVWADDPDHRIFLGGGYHGASNIGTDSRVGTLIHEMSHFRSVGGGTNKGIFRDEVYGHVACLLKAQVNPAYALNNADSFEYFMEDGFNEV